MNLLKDYRVIPLEETDAYVKVMVPRSVDPFLLEEIRFNLSKEVIPELVEDEVFSAELQRLLSQEEIALEGFQEGGEERVDILLEEESGPAVSKVQKPPVQVRRTD